MDIFNRKRVKELEEKLHEAKRDRDKYIFKAKALTEKLEAIAELKESIPADCTKGPWCKSCEFVRTFHDAYKDRYGNYYSEPFYVCGKGESCKNFVAK